jgi:hypothetical protein
MSVTAETFLDLGQEITNRRKRVAAKTMISRFRATFGTSPKICALLWGMVESRTVLPNGAKPVHLLWALAFLKLYCAEAVLAALVGGVDEKTFRKWAWYFVEQISDLQYTVICWANRFQGDVGNLCLVSVDGTDFQIYQWKPFWKGWFSHKFKGPGVRYEVGLCIMTGHIVWIHGPFPCGKWPDLKIFRNAMKQQLSPGEKVQADLGYRGEPDYIVLPTGVNDIGQRVRARHETVNKRFKQWGILHRVFRHEVSKHQPAFGSVAVITELAIEHGEELFGVEGYNV